MIFGHLTAHVALAGMGATKDTSRDPRDYMPYFNRADKYKDDLTADQLRKQLGIDRLQQKIKEANGLNRHP